MRAAIQIPVYAESQEEYSQWRDGKVGPFREAALRRGDTAVKGEVLGQKTWGITWRYNRIVGWVELKAAPDVIKGYLWWTTNKRIRRDRKEPFQFEHVGKLFETWVYDDMTALAVYKQLDECLTDAMKEPPLLGRWLDREAFVVAGYIDWPRLLGWSS